MEMHFLVNSTASIMETSNGGYVCIAGTESSREFGGYKAAIKFAVTRICYMNDAIDYDGMSAVVFYRDGEPSYYNSFRTTDFIDFEKGIEKRLVLAAKGYFH